MHQTYNILDNDKKRSSNLNMHLSTEQPTSLVSTKQYNKTTEFT